MSDAPNPLIPPPAPRAAFSVGGLTPDETTMAALAHLLQPLSWWIGPLVIFLVKRESKFVAFHALQALLWQIFRICFYVFFFVGVFFFIFAMVVPDSSQNTNNQMPPAIIAPFVFVFLFCYLGLFALTVADLVFSILFGIKAGRGEWANYPLLGKLARRLLHLPETGAPESAHEAFLPRNPQG